jgi:hypothetical protein
LALIFAIRLCADGESTRHDSCARRVLTEYSPALAAVTLFFSLPILPLWLNLLLKVMALSLLTLDLVLFNALQGSKALTFSQFLGNKRQQTTALLLTAASIDIAYAYATPVTWWMAAPYLRAALCAIYSPGILQQLDVMRRLLKHVVEDFGERLGHLPAQATDRV